MTKLVHFGEFCKPEARGRTVLSDWSILVGKKLAENAKIEKLKCDILSNFQTMWTTKLWKRKFYDIFPVKDWKFKASKNGLKAYLAIFYLSLLHSYANERVMINLLRKEEKEINAFFNRISRVEKGMKAFGLVGETWRGFLWTGSMHFRFAWWSSPDHRSQRTIRTWWRHYSHLHSLA